MPSITLTLTDTPDHTVAIHSSFVPAVGHPLSPAQLAALEIMLRTNREWGIKAKLGIDCNKPKASQ